MAKLKEKFKRATAVTLTMPGGKQKVLSETERHACAHALSGHLQNWEQRCAALYQVIGSLADFAGVFETSNDVSAALDVACGRGDVEKLLPWPKDVTHGKAARPEEGRMDWREMRWLEDELMEIARIVAPTMSGEVEDGINCAIMVTGIRRLMEADLERYEALLDRWQKRNQPQGDRT